MSAGAHIAQAGPAGQPAGPGGHLAADALGAARWIGRDPHAVEEVEPRYLDDRPGITLDLAPPDLLRTEIAVGTGVAHAELLATARGIMRTWIAGRRVGDDELAPGWTDYRVRMPVRRYDVTALLRAATADADGGPTGDMVCWSAAVADGWWAGYVGMDRRRQARWYGSAPAYRALLAVTHADGRTETFTTGGDWRRATGARRYADLLMGEMIDLDLEPHGWQHAGFDDSGWLVASVQHDDVAVLTESVDPPVRVVDELAPQRVWVSPAGALVADFGANVVGRLRIDTAALPAGTRLHLRHGETVLGDEVYVENLRTARAHDLIVVGATPAAEAVEPIFTYHGFRYAEITGHPGTLADIERTVRAVVLASDMATTGAFSCSDAAIDAVHANVVRTIRGNTVALPTDCPQRDERLGWMADTQLITPTTAHLFDAGTFYDQWLLAVRDGQSPVGGFPDVAPRLVVEVDGAPGWTDAGVLVPWALHRHDGDLARLARHYPAMVRFMDWVHAANPDLVRRRAVQHNYGDWLSLGGPIDKAVLATAYWALDATVMAAMAAALGRADDAAHWRALAADVRAAFIAEFVGDAGDLRLLSAPGSRGQTPVAMALALDLVPAALRARCAEHLVERIAAFGGALCTGIHGTRFLLPALSDTGHIDVAYGLAMRQDYPSWQYALAQGATTMWERWDAVGPNGLQTPALNSMNHPALGTVAEWLHAYVAGLRPATDRVEIRPFPAAPLTHAVTATRIGGDTVEVGWRIVGERLELRATIPAGLAATIHVPALDAVGGWRRHEHAASDAVTTVELDAVWDPQWRPADSGPGLLVGAIAAHPEFGA